MKKRELLFQILRCSWKPLVSFELLYKLLAVTFFSSLLSLSFRWIVEISGYSYLTVDNIFSFIRNPVAIVLLFFLVLCVAFYTIFDICAILYAVDLGRRNRPVGLRNMLAHAARASARVFLPRNWPLAVFSLFLLPFLNIGVLSSYMGTVAIPEFAEDFFSDHSQFLLLGLAAVGLFLWIMLRWMYLFHFYLLEGLPFRKARKASSALGRGHHIRDLGAVVLLQAAYAAAFLLAAFLLIAVIAALARIFAAAQMLRAFLTTAVWFTLCLLFLIFSSLAVPLSFCCITVLYETHRQKPSPVPAEEDPPEGTICQGFSRQTGAAILLVCLLCCAAYIGRLAMENANFKIEYLQTAEVTAHRGASSDYPENTMAAFRGAAEQGADWIELDVQQTSDGVIVVMHDTYLYRTTGLEKNIWETSYAELQAADAGSWFSADFSGEPVPLLSEVLDFAKEEEIRLNIELKPTGHETNFEKAVVDLVRDVDYLDACVITSQTYTVLEKVKAYCPEAKTVCVMSVAYGDLLRLAAADAFSVKSVNITAGMVDRVHTAGKEIYAWTVNRKKSMEKMLYLQVDNIITDQVLLAKECIYSDKTSNFIQDYITFLLAF